MTNKRVSINIIDNIAHVKLNRADKLNALDVDMFVGIKQAINTLKQNRAIRVIILSGDGKSFCSGLDVKSMMSSSKNMFKLLFQFRPWRANLAQVVSTGWREIPVPVICAIHGKCWGGGLQIALGADFRFATPDCSMSIMEGRWGLIPDMGGTLAFRELMPIDQAKKLAMTAEEFSGEQALALNLVTKLSATPLEDAIDFAKSLCNQSPDALAATKMLYNKSWLSSTGWALFRESYYQLKIIFGKNIHIKTYNQTHEPKKHKTFTLRKPW